MIEQEQPISPPTAVARMVEDIVGCKWSLAVIGAVRGGVHRPGALEHAIDGLSKKVLNERLGKLVRFGILEKHAWSCRRAWSTGSPPSAANFAACWTALTRCNANSIAERR